MTVEKHKAVERKAKEEIRDIEKKIVASTSSHNTFKKDQICKEHEQTVLLNTVISQLKRQHILHDNKVDLLMKDMHDMLAEVKETDMSEEVAAETIKV
jgi:hypothetical protein